jgi:hypothetical protein
MLDKKDFKRIVNVDFPPKYALTEIMGVRRLRDRKQIVFRLTNASKCHEEKDVLGAVDFRKGDLLLSWINEKIQIDRSVQAKVTDVDGDGEQEMIFAEDRWLDPKKAHSPLILRGLDHLMAYVPAK